MPADGGGLTPGKSLVYHFNDAGNAISVNDGIVYGCFAGYNTSLPLNQPDAERKKHLLKKTTSPLGVTTESTYDTKGNPLTGKTRDSASAKVIATSTTYTTDQNYVATQTDARGKTVTTVTDPDKGTVTSVTDAGGQEVTYTYDAMKRVTGTSAVVGSKTILSQSTYTHDLLTETAHNTTPEHDPRPGNRRGYHGALPVRVRRAAAANHGERGRTPVSERRLMFRSSKSHVW